MQTRASRNIAWTFILSGALLPLASAQQTIEGFWRSQGYGFVIDVQPSGLKAFEVTTTTCVPSLTATRSANAAPDREETFTTRDKDVFFVRTGGSPDHKLLHLEGSVSDMRIDRLPRLPSICDSPTANTPLDNFETFTRTWAENYISFDLKHVDWDKVVAENRAKITPDLSPTQLFGALESMIKPFGDAHTSLNAPKLKRGFHGLRPGTDRPAGGIRALFRVTERAYLHSPLKKFCNGQVEYGHIDPATGYLRIISFSGYSKQGDFASGSAALQSALDEIFSDSALRALVIDVRVNFGGDDPYGIDIAARLATAEYLAYTKQARSDPADHNKWTARDPSIVRPSSRPGFHGPVVELIGPFTISAGETFTQALMGRTPRVQRIGENTQGVFSDVLGRRLPNGWTFGLPNEVYLTPEEKAFDGAGIPPDIEVPVFTATDVKAGKDPALAKALQILAAR